MKHAKRVLRIRLSEFSVNKVTTSIGSDLNGSLTNHPCSSVSISGQNIPDHLFYDCEGNLSCVSNSVSGAVDSYWYDSVGRRIAKQENGLLTLYLWDGMTVIATANADGTLREYFTRGPGIAGDVGSLIAETRFTGGTASTTYLHSNWRGDVVMATDTAGSIIGEYAYTTFGEPLSSSGTYTPRFGFSSKERDASGLVYYGFRYYSPILCRWISEDPIGEAGGLNLYQFCGNDPVNGVDPYGWLDINLFPTNENIRAHADLAKTPGSFGVGMHGSDTALQDEMHNKVAVPDLAKKIIEHPDYTPGQSVTLASCSAGVGKNSNAQKLANELTKQTGVSTEVKGPNSLLYIDKTGKMKVDGVWPFHRWMSFRGQPANQGKDGNK